MRNLLVFAMMLELNEKFGCNRQSKDTGKHGFLLKIIRLICRKWVNGATARERWIGETGGQREAFRGGGWLSVAGGALRGFRGCDTHRATLQASHPSSSLSAMPGQVEQCGSVAVCR